MLDILSVANRIPKSTLSGQFLMRDRRERVVIAAKQAGLLQGVRSAIGARVPQPLIDAAKAKTGLESTTDIVEYALAKVALEDNFGAKLVARKGRVAKGLDLDL
jgi:hypothetical protein